jgi:superfamily II DNA or RNA helicase
MMETETRNARAWAKHVVQELSAKPLTQAMAEVPQEFRGYAFSHVVCELMAQSGYTNAKCIDGAGDGGVDILSDQAVVQCKTQRLSQSEVRLLTHDISSSYPHHREHIVVSLRGFPDAIETVKRSSKLWGPDDLDRMGRNYGRKSDAAQFDLLPHNAELRDRMLDALHGGKSVFLGAATGTGKSMLAAYLIHQMRHGRVLYVAPTAAHSQIDVTLAKHAAMSEMELSNVTRTTYDSLKHYAMNRYDLLILDEVHQAGAPTRQEPVKLAIKNAGWVLGLSATRWRTIAEETTVKHMESIASFLTFDEVLDGHDLPSATAHGIVKRIRYIRVVPNDQIEKMNRQLKAAKDAITGPSEFDLGIDYQLTENLMMKRMRAGRSVMFCATVRQARKRCAELVMEGIAAREYTSQTANAEDSLAWFRDESGGAKVLVSCLKAAEAIHCTVDNVVLFRVTHSYRLYLQMLGRAVKAGFAEGGDPHVFDVMNCVSTVPPRFSYVETVKAAIAEYDSLRVESGALPLHTGYAPCAEEEQSELMYRVIERAVRGVTFEDVVAWVREHGRMPKRHGVGEFEIYKASLELRKARDAGKLNDKQIAELSNLEAWIWKYQTHTKGAERIKKVDKPIKPAQAAKKDWNRYSLEEKRKGVLEWLASDKKSTSRHALSSVHKWWRHFKDNWTAQPEEWRILVESVPVFTFKPKSEAHRANLAATLKAHSSLAQFARLRDKVFELTGIRHKTGKFKTATSQELEATLAAHGLTPYEIKCIRYAGDTSRCGEPV